MCTSVGAYKPAKQRVRRNINSLHQAHASPISQSSSSSTASSFTSCTAHSSAAASPSLRTSSCTSATRSKKSRHPTVQPRHSSGTRHPTSTPATQLTHASRSSACCTYTGPRSAYVVPSSKPASAAEFEKEIQEWVKSRVAQHKRLRGGVKIIDAVPKSAAGKILRRELRDLAKQEVKTQVKTKL
ncbi:hypothetical protein EWM64_g1770 [Hericium alpestre]|uniref:AMP-binding enzyme C-terminal domain-containing protein n=1 Tax=Hericium alpestre TaxID=135208 RepID=A0A4Z0A5F2_9AGAM|nr:hypothetical protein EWM64_g1770 [Hericium alpestre]